MFSPITEASARFLGLFFLKRNFPCWALWLCEGVCASTLRRVVLRHASKGLAGILLSVGAILRDGQGRVEHSKGREPKRGVFLRRTSSGFLSLTPSIKPFTPFSFPQNARSPNVGLWSERSKTLATYPSRESPNWRSIVLFSFIVFFSRKKKKKSRIFLLT